MRIIKIAFIASLTILLIAFATSKIDDSDTMQYLANGKYMLAHGIYSNFCFYNYVPHACQQAYLHEWFFHLATYLIYLSGNWYGMVLFQIAIILGLFSTIVIAAKLFRYSIFSTGLFALLGMLVGMERFSLRADLFGLFLIASFYVIVRYYIEAKLFETTGASKYIPLIILLILEVIWTNTHISFQLSFVILLAYFLAYCIEFLVNREKRVFFSSYLKAFGIIFVVCLIGSLINPYGIPAFWYLFTFLTQNATIEYKTNGEWISPLAPTDFYRHSIIFFKFFLLPSIAIPFIVFKKIRIVDIFLLAFFMYLSITSVRNIAFLAIFAALILPYYLDLILISIKAHVKPSIVSFSITVIMVIITILAVYLTHEVITNNYYTTNQNTKRFGLGISENSYPIGASNFIEKNNIKGNIFNDYVIGSYLNWRLYPTRKTFIDGHTFSYENLLSYDGVISGRLDYNKIASKYHITVFMLNHTSQDTILLIRALYNDKKWILVYLDEITAVFIKDTPANRAIIKKYAIHFGNNTNYDLTSLPTFKEKDDIGTGYINRGIFFLRLGLIKEAYVEFQKAITYAPNNFQSYSGLGALYFALGQMDNGFPYFEKAVALEPNYSFTHANLGIYYSKKGLYDKALDEYNQALTINSTLQGINYQIGVIYLKLGDIVKAKQYFQQELEVNPTSSDAKNALRILSQ